MAITWSCRISVAEYAALGRSVRAPRRNCSNCQRPLAFDGSYPRQVREAGVVHTIFVRRARCATCKVGDALLPDFVLRGRLDSAGAIGVAILAAAGVPLSRDEKRLSAKVPARTVRSWQERFAERAPEFALHFAALCVEWGGFLSFPPPCHPTPTHHALDSIGQVWRALNRRPDSDLPPAWRLANVIIGSQLLSTRVDLPWPIKSTMIGRSRAP